MRNSRAVLGSLGALAAAVTLVVAAAVPAGAAGPFTVKVGTKTTGSYNISAATVGAAPQIKLSSGDVNMSCASGTAAGRVTAGQNATGAAVATITSSTWSACKGPLNLDMTVTQKTVWRLNATSVNPTTGVVAGRVVNVNARVSTANPNQCSFDAIGAVQASFNPTPTTNQKLTLTSPTPTLKIQNVVGCFGLLANGDTASFRAVYKVNSPSGPISITSP